MDRDLIDVFFSTAELNINSNNRLIEMSEDAKKEGGGWEVEFHNKHLQDRIDALLAKNEKITVAYDELKEDPTEETLERVQAVLWGSSFNG